MPEWEPLQRFLNAPHGTIRYVLAPFIQEGALRFLLEDPDPETVIVTRWRPDDIHSGASDLGAYLAAKDHGWTFRIHPTIHLKAYAWDLEQAYVGSANVTNRALGIQGPINEEYLVGPIQVPLDRRLQMQRIVHESQVVTDAIHRAAWEWQEAQLPVPRPEPLDFGAPDRRFLVSALPMSRSPTRMLEVLATMDAAPSSEQDLVERSCAIHDACNFRLDRMGDQIGSASLDVLRDAFFDAPFVQAIEQQLQPCIQFGALKAWIQENCHDVPVPSRRDLTGNVQVLLAWFHELEPTTYSVDVPGAYSQRLCNRRRMHQAD